MAKLTARKVETAKTGKHGDGAGLQLVVSPTGARKWVLRFQWQGRAREMGLGAFPVVSLEQARDAAREARKLAKTGIDPIADKGTEKTVPTFGELADTVAADLSAGFRNEKHKAQWEMTLRVYAKPLHRIPVGEVTSDDVLGVLKPMWTEKPETASRLRGRIEKAIDYATALGQRTGENPGAHGRGHLASPSRRSNPGSTRGHHAAMPYRRRARPSSRAAAASVDGYGGAAPSSSPS
ncbi:MAG: Arm DNA-binding domain-containing protein [Rhodoblastus sp.]